MRRALFFLAAVLAGCGGLEPEIEPPPVPTIAVGETPNGVDVLPPGWFLHFYPGLCVVLVRDADGFVRRCFNFYPDPCVPADPRACSPFPIGSR